MDTLGTGTSITEGVCDFLFTELRRSIHSVFRVELIGNQVFILYRETLQGEQYSIDERVRELSIEIEGGHKFEYITRKTCTNLLETSEVEREMLEARVRTRVRELTENGTLHGQIESVRVKWTCLSILLRAFGVDFHETHGVITLRNLSMTGFADRTLLLRALRSDFGIPMSIRGDSHS